MPLKRSWVQLGGPYFATNQQTQGRGEASYLPLPLTHFIWVPSVDGGCRVYAAAGETGFILKWNMPYRIFHLFWMVLSLLCKLHYTKSILQYKQECNCNLHHCVSIRRRRRPRTKRVKQVKDIRVGTYAPPTTTFRPLGGVRVREYLFLFCHIFINALVNLFCNIFLGSSFKFL